MSPTPKPAALFGRMGSHLAISLGIALAIAGALSLPKQFRARVQASTVTVLPSANMGDGKFSDRLSFGIGEDREAGRVFTPAVLAMPMVAAWPEQEPSLAPAPGPAAPLKLRTAVASPAPLPPRRDPALADAGFAAPPLQLFQTVAGPSPVQKPEDEGWSRIVTAPAGKVADVVSGTAGLAQAAGSWTLNQAAGLLPRW